MKDENLRQFAGCPRGTRIHPGTIWVYVTLVYAITWALWLPATLTKLNGGTPALGPDSPVGQLGRCSPGVVAILLTLILAGKQGLKHLFQPLAIWRVHVGWYVTAILLQPAIFLIARWIDNLLGSSDQLVSPLASISYPLAFVLPIMIISAFPGSFAEELGWRGFALPGLQSKFNALVASVILAFVWGIWHIPSMLYGGQTQVFDVAFAVLNFIPVTILYTWMYNNTKGSLLLVTLLHLGQQLSNSFLGIIPSMTDDVLVWLIAIVLVWLYGMQLKKHELQVEKYPVNV